MLRASPLSFRGVAAMALAASLAPLNSTMLSVSLPSIGASLGSDARDLTLSLVTSYLVTSVVSQAPGGRIGDQFGHRRALLLGQVGFAITSVVSMIAPSLSVLVGARIVMGIAGALVVPSVMARLRTELPFEMRGRAFGVFGGSMSLAAAVGPLIGGLLTTAIHWRATFAVNLVVLLVSSLLARGQAHSEPRHSEAFRFDWVGTLLFGASLSGLVLGVGGHDRAPNATVLAASTVLFAAFIVVERRIERPMIDLRLLNSGVFVAGGLLIAFHNLATYALLFELPMVLGIVLDAKPSEAGQLLVALMTPMVVTSPFAGRWSDRFGARAVALVGAAFAVGGMTALVLTPLTSLASQIPGLLLLGTGLGVAGPPAQSAGMSAVAARLGGAAAGMMTTLRYLGGVVGTLFLGIIFSKQLNRESALAAHGLALRVFLVATALSLVCAFALKRRRFADDSTNSAAPEPIGTKRA